MYTKILYENDEVLLHSLKQVLDKYISDRQLVTDQLVLENLKKDMSVVIAALSNRMLKDTHRVFYYLLNDLKLTPVVFLLKKFVYSTIKDIQEAKRRNKIKDNNDYQKMIDIYSDFNLSRKTELYKALNRFVFKHAREIISTHEDKRDAWDLHRRVHYCAKFAKLLFANVNIQNIVAEYEMQNITHNQNVSEKQTNQVTDKLVDKAINQKVSEKADEKVDEKQTNQVSDKLVDKAIDQKVSEKQTNHIDKPINEKAMDTIIEKEINKNTKTKIKLINAVYALFFLTASYVLFAYAKSKIDEYRNKELSLQTIINVIKYVFKNGSITDKVVITLSAISLVASVYVLYSRILKPLVSVVKDML